MQFHIEELIARVNIQLKDPAEIKNKNIISYGDIELNIATSRLTCKNTGETVEFEVSGDKIEAIYMIPGWTHNIINLSDTEDLVTVMTCNEIFDPEHPDTFGEPV